MKKPLSFVLTDILIVIAIVLVVMIVVVWMIDPKKMIAKSRDNQRQTDLTKLTTALNLYLADDKNFAGLNGPYLSSSGQNKTQNNGLGWLPIKFDTISSGAPLSSLPIDPINNASYHYSVGFDTVHGTFEIDCVLESSDEVSKMSSDGGNNPEVFEVGTDLTILS